MPGGESVMKRLVQVSVSTLLLLNVLACQKRETLTSTTETVKPQQRVVKKVVESTNVHVLFTGIVSFVKRKDQPRPASLPAITFAKQSDYGQAMGASMTIPIQRPFSVIDTDQNKYVTSETPKTVSHYAIFFIEDSDIQIINQLGSDLVWDATPNDKGECPDPPLPFSRMYTVPRICYLGTCGDSPAVETSSARLPMNKGTTAAYVTAQKTSWFKTYGGNPVLKQRVAQILDWQTSVKGEALTLTRASISGGGAHTFFMTIYPDGDGNISIVMGNAKQETLEKALAKGYFKMDPAHHF